MLFLIFYSNDDDIISIMEFNNESGTGKNAIYDIVIEINHRHTSGISSV